MPGDRDQFDTIMKSLTTLNWDQIKFLRSTAGHLLADVSPEEYRENGEDLAKEYSKYTGLLDGSNTCLSFPDLLLAMNHFDRIGFMRYTSYATKSFPRTGISISSKTL
jgi:hypothetical protein